jgi:hypothetical protein
MIEKKIRFANTIPVPTILVNIGLTVSVGERLFLQMAQERNPCAISEEKSFYLLQPCQGTMNTF